MHPLKTVEAGVTVLVRVFFAVTKKADKNNGEEKKFILVLKIKLFGAMVCPGLWALLCGMFQGQEKTWSNSLVQVVVGPHAHPLLFWCLILRFHEKSPVMAWSPVLWKLAS